MQTPRPYLPQLTWPGLWLLVCGWLVTTGWLLSAISCLGHVGYSISLAGLVIALCVVRRSFPRLRPCPHKPWRRFRRFPACLHALTFGLALIGGILYAPSNYDALGYRLPRMLHWLAEGNWHWIHSCHAALNTRASSSEWINFPLLLFPASDRFLFFTNIASFALLPGLVFGILRRLGLGARVAWHWMWIFPSGYCFALQAGGIGNDITGATLFLGGLFHALKARQSRHWSDFALACVGMALATGTKTSNIPLGLPWLLAMLPSVPMAWKYPLRNLALAPILILCSFLPNAYLNHKHCGDWTGLAVEPVVVEGNDHILYATWNSVYLMLQNLTPPVFPISSHWNEAVSGWIPQSVSTRLANNFESDAATLKAPETLMEENAPLGLGICGLLAIGVLGTIRMRRPHSPPPDHRDQTLLRRLVCGGAWLALSPILLMFGLTGSGRYLAPHYLLLILPLLALPSLGRWYRTKTWTTTVSLTFCALFATMTLSAARPLWPALTVLDAVGAKDSASPLLNRAWNVYRIYRQRPQAFAPIRSTLPEEEKTIGFFTGNTPEASLWKPFGSRRILHILPTDSTESIRSRGIRTIVAGERTMEETGFPALQDWCRTHHASIVGRAEFPVMVRKGIDQWFLIRMDPSEAEHDEAMDR